MDEACPAVRLMDYREGAELLLVLATTHTLPCSINLLANLFVLPVRTEGHQVSLSDCLGVSTGVGTAAGSTIFNRF